VLHLQVRVVRDNCAAEIRVDARCEEQPVSFRGERREKERRRATNVGCCSVGLEKSCVMHGQIQLRHIHNSLSLCLSVSASLSLCPSLELSLVLHINRQEARVSTFSVSNDLTFLILQNISKRRDSRGIL